MYLICMLLLYLLQDISDVEKLRSILWQRNLSVYWGIATAGQPHIGLFVAIYKVADFLKAGCQVTMTLFWSICVIRHNFLIHNLLTV